MDITNLINLTNLININLTNLAQPYRSTSPSTISRLPRMTTASATFWPMVISRIEVRLMKDDERTW